MARPWREACHDIVVRIRVVTVPVHRQPVIADVARVAGVSVPTVSRVLTGSTPVSDRKRAQVMKAIEELGFRPNGAARALVSGRRSMIAVITGNTTFYGYATTIQGIEEAARQVGLVVSITVVDSTAEETVRAAVNLALGQPIAGAIVLEFDRQGSEALGELPDSIAIVAVSSTMSGRPVRRVLFDDYRGGYDATKYLLSLGHRTVHHVSVPGASGPSGRLVGWQDALREQGAELTEAIETDWTSQSGYRAGLELAADPSVTAIFCGNDEIAFGVIKALHDAGKRVPEEISVVGFDDHPHSVLWSPPLTTVAQDFAQLGRAAVEHLLSEIDPTSPEPEKTEGSLHLVIRGSSAPPPAA
jgi:DNA-binding LacI/PurR family transcriptional regulator